MINESKNTLVMESETSMKQKNTCLEKYLLQVERNGGDKKMRDSIKDVARSVCNYFELLDDTEKKKDKVVLLFGQVQSGKTSHLLGILCKVADLQAKNLLILLLTSDNDDLYSQTLSRTRNDLQENSFFILGEKDFDEFRNQMSRNHYPVILVMKKNARILNKWKDYLIENQFLRDKTLLVADDEADAASLNTFASREGSLRRSAVHGAIEEIRKLSKSTFYLQVTGTPQALLLQKKEEGENNFRPCQECVIPVSDKYMGGNFFFTEENPENNSAVIILQDNSLDKVAEKEKRVKEVVLRGLIVGAQELLAGKKVANSLIHPDRLQKEHDKFAKLYEQTIQQIKEDYYSQAFKTQFEKAYDKWLSNYELKKSSDEIYEFISKLLDNKTKVVVINSKAKSTRQYIDWNQGCNFIIGGDSLGRGITIPNIITVFYSRLPKKQNQADTIWQHNRWFGYDRNKQLIKLFIPEQLYKNFQACNRVNNEIISFFKSKEVGECPFFGYPDTIQPTRKSILPASHLIRFPGGANYNFKNPTNVSVEDIDRLISSLPKEKLHNNGKENTQIYRGIDPDFILKIFKHVENEDYLQYYNSIIKNHLREENSAVLIVCREREVSRAHGKLLSPDIREEGEKWKDKLVVTLYEIKAKSSWTKEERWSSDRLWVPNIKLPNPEITYSGVKENWLKNIN